MYIMFVITIQLLGIGDKRILIRKCDANLHSARSIVEMDIDRFIDTTLYTLLRYSIGITPVVGCICFEEIKGGGSDNQI